MTHPILHTLHPQFAESYKTFHQKLGFEPQKPVMGGFRAQQAPNTIIVTHPVSLYWCGDLGTKPIQLFLCFPEVRDSLIDSLLDLLHPLGRSLTVRGKSLS